MPGETTTIARPYAEAVFARAKETGELDAWGDALGMLSSIAADPAMAKQITSPSVPRERLSKAILEIAGERLSAEARNLVSLLAANDRLSLLQEIARLYNELKIAHQGVRRVEIVSAFDLDESTLKELSEALARRFGAQVDIRVDTDPSLIGGVRVQAGDLVIDGSVSGKLQQLASELQI